MKPNMFRNAGETLEILLYDEIGESFWGDGIGAKAFAEKLNEFPDAQEIRLRINSPGGDVFEGLAIYNSLLQHKADIVVDIDGLAASIASVIALAGDTVRMASNAMFMIHNPWTMAAGDSAEMRRVGDLLDQVKGSLLNTYQDRTDQDRTELAKWMDEETWLDAERSVELGFATEVAAASRVAACVSPGRFRNTPDALLQAPAAVNPVSTADSWRLPASQRALQVAKLKLAAT